METKFEPAFGLLGYAIEQMNTCKYLEAATCSMELLFHVKATAGAGMLRI